MKSVREDNSGHAAIIFWYLPISWAFIVIITETKQQSMQTTEHAILRGSV